ncbi:hypothetical protein ACFQX6_64505 [Streptosporangium lutulentum]
MTLARPSSRVCEVPTAPEERVGAAVVTAVPVEATAVDGADADGAVCVVIGRPPG